MRLNSKPSDQGITQTKIGKTDKDNLLLDFIGKIEELIARYAEISYLIKGRLDYAVEQIINDLGNILKELTMEKTEIITRYNVEWLEENIRVLKAEIKNDTSLPYAYNLAAARLNILRSIVREAERYYFKLKKLIPVSDIVGQYLNRLSDLTLYMFKYTNLTKKKFIEMEGQ